jgi:hypothetical protein
VVLAEDVRAVRGDAAVGAAGFVPVVEFLRDAPEVEGDPQHQRVRVAEPPLPGRQGLLEDAPRRGRVAGGPAHGSELVQTGQHGWVVGAESLLRLCQRLRQYRARPVEITGALQLPGMLLGGRER